MFRNNELRLEISSQQRQIFQATGHLHQLRRFDPVCTIMWFRNAIAVPHVLRLKQIDKENVTERKCFGTNVLVQCFDFQQITSPTWQRFRTCFPKLHPDDEGEISALPCWAGVAPGCSSMKPNTIWSQKRMSAIKADTQNVVVRCCSLLVVISLKWSSWIYWTWLPVTKTRFLDTNHIPDQPKALHFR